MRIQALTRTEETMWTTVSPICRPYSPLAVLAYVLEFVKPSVTSLGRVL